MGWSSRALAGVVAAVVVWTAGCSSDEDAAPTTSVSPSASTTPTDRADAACAAAGLDPLFSAAPGTLGEARGWTVGTGAQPLVDAFPDADGSSFIAWCWTNTGGFFESFIADDAGRSMPTGATSNGAPPPGPPDIP